jgi:hypothetical protein
VGLRQCLGSTRGRRTSVKLPAPVSELGELWLGVVSVTPLLGSGDGENCHEGTGGGGSFIDLGVRVQAEKCPDADLQTY